jgi:hypothetical protein
MGVEGVEAACCYNREMSFTVHKSLGHLLRAAHMRGDH